MNELLILSRHFNVNMQVYIDRTLYVLLNLAHLDLCLFELMIYANSTVFQ